MSTTTTITSVTDMKAVFAAPPPSLSVLGTPNLHNLVEILIYLARCAQTHKSTISPNMNLLYVAVPPTVYAHYTAEPYPVGMYPYPPRPTDAPNFVGANGSNEREARKVTHAIETKRYHDVQNMNTALIDTFLTLLPPPARLAYESIRIMNPNAVFRDVFQWFLEKYGETQATDRKNNLDRMTTQWTPTDGFDSLVHRLFLAETYATCANHPLQPHQILDAAVIVIQNCGLYPEEMKAWKKRTPAEGNDYAAFKVFWEQAIRVADTSTATPAAQYDYGMNINEISGDDKSNASRTSALESSISTFGSAYAATEERVRTQTDTINNMQGQLNALQQQLCHAVMTRPPTYPPPYNPRNNNYNNNNNQRGGYGNGGRGGGYQRNNNQHMPTGPPATQMSVPTPYKRFENMNYCHTHGGDVDDFHTSTTCSKPGPYHVYHATRDNTMGGSISGLHKTIMPSASGRRPAQNRTPQYNNGYNRAPMLPTMQQPPMQQQQHVRPPANPSGYYHNNMQPQMMPPPLQQPMAPPNMAPTHHRAMAMMAPTMPAYPSMQTSMPAPMQQQQYYGYNY